MNPIVFDSIIYSLQKGGGISVYWKMLEEKIVPNKRLVYKGCEQNIFYESSSLDSKFNTIVLFERYKNLVLPDKESFIFHSSYYRYCKNKNAINITTVHDFTYERFRTDLKSWAHKIQKKNTVMHSDGVICISENTKRDLYHFYPEYKGKVKVIYHGYDNSLFCNKNYNQRTNNVVFVGQRGGYKNFNLAVKILSQIEGLNLVIIGGGDLNNIELSMLNNYLPNRYKKLNFIPNEELVHLYNSSFALIYPSSYEGFGFPIIEAQACGCPVICQQVSSIPEVSGDKCVYISDSNLVKSVENVKQLFNQHFYIKIQCDGLENVKRFSWDKCIKDTKEFYASF